MPYSANIFSSALSAQCSKMIYVEGLEAHKVSAILFKILIRVVLLLEAELTNPLV